MSVRVTVTFTDAQWRIIKRHAPGGKHPYMLRSLVAEHFADKGVTYPSEEPPVGGYRGGGRPKKPKSTVLE